MMPVEQEMTREHVVDPLGPPLATMGRRRVSEWVSRCDRRRLAFVPLELLSSEERRQHLRRGSNGSFEPRDPQEDVGGQVYRAGTS